PYAVVWTKLGQGVVGNAATIAVSEPGTYTVTATGANGCSDSDSVIVTEDKEPPTVNAGPDQELSCDVRVVSLTVAVCAGRSPYTYKWQDSLGNVVGTRESVTVDAPDTYTVVVTGANGCSANDSVRVTENVEPPVVNAGADQTLTCAITEVALTANVTGGRPPYVLEWTKPGAGVIGSTPCIIVSDPGTYTVTATGTNGCTAGDTVTVLEDVEPPTVDVGPDRHLDCRVRQVTLKATVTGGRPPFTYEWTNSLDAVVGTAYEFTVDAPDVYTFTVTGANGCSASDSVTVTQDIEPPVVDAGPDRRITCANPEVTLNATVSGGREPYAFVWQDESGTTIACTGSIVVFEPGTYVVTVVGANGCCASDEVTVTQDIAPPVVDAGLDQELSCEVRVVLLTVSVCGGCSPYTYKWQDSSGNVVGTAESVTVDALDTYTVTATGANGCAASDCVTVTEDVDPPVVEATVDQTLTCVTTEVTLTAHVTGGRPPYAIEWTKPGGGVIGTTACIIVSKPGTYFVTATGANGCSDRDSVIVTEDKEPPTVDAGPNQELTCANAEVLIDVDVYGGAPPYTYLWTDECGKEIAVTEDITVTLPGLYIITVTGANDCSSTALVNVINKINPPKVDTGQDKVLTCEIGEVLLDATVSGGMTPYEYVWTNACGVVVGRTQDLMVTLPSLYTLTVITADGCLASDSVEVTQESESKPTSL
ncbi:MAG: hypothetical protein AMJ46_13955, partial [Latescibacteria bacterium DG_63]